MSENEYMSIKVFADLVGISVQSVYKQKRLQPYIQIMNGRKRIASDALNAFYKGFKVERVEKVECRVESTVEKPKESQRIQGKKRLKVERVEGLKSKVETVEISVEYLQELKDEIAFMRGQLDTQSKTIAMLSSKMELIEQRQSEPEPEIIVEAVQPIREEKEEPKETDFWKIKKPAGWLSILLDEANKKGKKENG